ncbi:hypothetical protein ACWXVO_03140, partial [Mycoplasma sp. 1890]
AFDFPLEDDYIENELDIFPSNEPESSEPWETHEPNHNSPWEWDEGADEVSPNEPDHNQPWDEDDEPDKPKVLQTTQDASKLADFFANLLSGSLGSYGIQSDKDGLTFQIN